MFNTAFFELLVIKNSNMLAQFQQYLDKHLNHLYHYETIIGVHHFPSNDKTVLYSSVFSLIANLTTLGAVFSIVPYSI